MPRYFFDVFDADDHIDQIGQSLLTTPRWSVACIGKARPTAESSAALTSLLVYCAVYAVVGAFGVLFIYRLLRRGPGGPLALPPVPAFPRRPVALVNDLVHES